MSILNLIWIIIGGGIIGVIARMVMPGRQNIPLWATIIAGIIGMLVGNYLAVLFGVRNTGGIDWIRHILQVVVAVLAVAGVGAIMGRSKT